MTRIFATNIVGIDWKRTGVAARETWQAVTPIGPMEISKKYLNAGFLLKLPEGFPGSTSINCESADEARMRANEEVARRINDMIEI